MAFVATEHGWPTFVQLGTPITVYPLTHSLTDSLTHSLTHALTHSHSLTRSLTHSLTTHSLTHHTIARSLARTHALSLSLSHTHIHILTRLGTRTSSCLPPPHTHTGYLAVAAEPLVPTPAAAHGAQDSEAAQHAQGHPRTAANIHARSRTSIAAAAAAATACGSESGSRCGRRRRRRRDMGDFRERIILPRVKGWGCA
jgi:hypothetical protein